VTVRPDDLARYAVAFGSFRLLAGQHLLLESGQPVRLGSRALDILIALIERHGETVTNEELIARVWPKTYVEDGNLRVHIASLRKVLGEGREQQRYIANIPGRGYQFVAPVVLELEHIEAPPGLAPAAAATVQNGPARLSHVLGREDLIASLATDLSRWRLITLVGPGGIGKTTVASALAAALTPSYRDGVRFIDLTPITDPALLPGTFASEFGIVARADDPITPLVSHLRDKQMLLVLDSCEHVVDAAAVLTEKLLKGAAGIRILATSREPLRAEGERVQRLSPLAVPGDSGGLTVSKALDYPSVQLFVQRATVSLDEFELTDLDAPVVADICRRLDGIPLAIELAASRVDVFGVRGLLTLLDDRMRLVMKGRRTALPRHRTLAATLDWSYASLSDAERQVLRRLSIFAGAFAPKAAYAVAGGERTDADVIDTLANLVAKSLVDADIGGNEPRYSLLEMTRAYAHEKLVEAGELHETARRHAEYLRSLFAQAQAEWDSRPAAEWLEDYGHEIDNVRRALDWAFSPTGDPMLGVALSIAAVPLWMQKSLMNECRINVERALAHLASESGDNREARMQLYAALSLSLMYTMAQARDVDPAWRTTLALAEQCGNADYQLRAVWGLFAGAINSSNFAAALSLAQRFRALAQDANEQLIGDRIIGVALHFIGDQPGAREHTERMIAHYVAPTHGSHIIRFQNDQLVAARRVLAPVLWLQGYPEQAMRMIEKSVADALAIDHAITLCNMLSQSACPIALLTGDLEATERYVNLLIDSSDRLALEVWNAYGRGFRGTMLLRRGVLDEGLSQLRNAIADLRHANFTQYYAPFLGALAYGFGLTGEPAHGLATIDEALSRTEMTSERYFVPELLRIKGRLVQLQAKPECARVAEELYRRALDLASRQGALSWELRIAISLSMLLERGQRRTEAIGLLAPVLGRFTEGLETDTPKIARQLLKSWGAASPACGA